MRLAVLLVVLGATTEHASSYAPSFVPRNFVSSFNRPSQTKRQHGSQLYSTLAAPAPVLSQQQQRQTTTMLVETSGGMEELHELTEQEDGVISKQVRKSPSFWKMAGYASIPISAALGFGIVPSRRLAAHGVGAVVTGIAGAVGKSRLDALTEANAKPALAQAIVDNGLENPEQTAFAVQKVKDDFGLLDEDFDSLCTEIYSSYLLGMIKYNPIAKTSELKELEGIRTVLDLDNLQVGEAHAAAAEQWYRQTCLFTPEEELDDPGHPDRQAMDKYLFLTERALKQIGETDQAFTYEMTRVAKAFKLTYFQALERVSDVVEPFYQRALQSTRSKLGTNQVSSAMLDRARKTLGIAEESAKDMHVACFNAEVRSLLGLPDIAASDDDAEEEVVDLTKLTFQEDSSERLEKLRTILGLSETDADYEIALEATPVYQSTALKALEMVLDKTKTPDEVWKIMEDRRVHLLMKEDSYRTLISSMVMQALGRPLEETNKFAKVNNEAATYDNLLEALEAKEALIAILTKSGWDEFDNFDETFCNPWDKQSANGFLNSEERNKLYRIFVSRSIRKSEDGKLTDEMFERILEVKGLLGITDQQAEVTARSIFGPELQKVMQRVTTEITADYTPELAENMKKELGEVIKNYRLTDDFVREAGATFYSKAVGLVSEQSPGSIPSKELSLALESLRELFKLEKEDTYASHMEFFGSVYKKSVLEAMGTTGVIRPEFRGPLDDLRDRLGVSEDNCKELFLEAIEEKMVPMAEWIGSEMERTQLTQQQLSQRRGKDVGEDLFQTGKTADGVLGLGADVNIMSDIIELVDFYTENDIIEEVETTQTGEDGKEETITEKVYPVTALGSDAIDQEMAELLYRQFIVGGFTAQGEKAARYEKSRGTFAGILGLEKSKIEEINNNIGSTVYDNFVSNAMKTKGSMDQQDMMFLANIQTKLDITPEEGEKMLRDSQKKVLSEEINVLMDDPTPEGLKAFREKCNTMGVDMFEDVGISKARLTRMFESEITPALKDGTINVETSDVLGEIQESLGVEPEECEAMFESVLMRLSKNALDLIKGELLRGREDMTVDLIKELVRYAAFTEGDLGLVVDEATGNQIYNIYEAFDFDGVDSEVIETNKELLRTAMGIHS